MGSIWIEQNWKENDLWGTVRLSIFIKQEIFNKKLTSDVTSEVTFFYLLKIPFLIKMVGQGPVPYESLLKLRNG
jgi:hypothetical protein